nr:DNA-directed RNA polymerase, mitochondrial-like isoform X16 [Symphalangus syndactylus]
MSALCWGRGAAGLKRVLRPCGRPGLPAKEGTLGGVCGPRRSSSASPQERDQDRRKDWGHMELLEVLQARVRQLQAESVSEVVVNRVDVARLPECGSGDGSHQPPRKVQTGTKDATPVPCGRWAKRLEKDKWTQQMRMQRLEAKLQMPVQRGEFKVLTKRLRVEPQLLSKHLARCLEHCTHQAPKSPWEEQLAQVLQEAPPKPSPNVEQAPSAQRTQAQLSSQQQRLLAFFKCCLLTDHLPLAHHLLVTHHGHRQKQKLLTLDMYNTVMLGWARQGAFKELVYVLFMVKDAGLTPDLLSYAAALQCMGRRDQDAGTIERCLEQMSQEGLKLQALFTTVPLTEEDRATVLKAVHKVKPTFSLPPQLPPPVNTSKLLRDVYAKDGPVSYPKLHLPLKDLQCLFEKQLRVELASKVCVVSVEKPTLPSKEVTHARKTLKTLRDQWEKALCRALKETKNRLEREVHEGRFSLYPFLCLLDEREVVRMLLQVLQALPAQGESFTTLARELSARTFSRHVVQRQRLSGQVQALQNHYRKYLCLLASDTTIGILKPHPAYVQLLEKAAEPTLTFEAVDVPMLCPPLPWTSPHSGAFLLSPTKLMRTVEGATQHQELLETCPPTALHGALDALTQLGNCAWRVNGPVLDLVLQLFQAKGCPQLGVPAPPSEAPQPPEVHLQHSAAPARKAELRRELAHCQKVARDMHSLRVEALYRLSLAQHLRDCVFWLPHNMDFRGRTYPCPPHFNHLGSDVARALLEFAQGRPLGPHGLDWLKIHLVNLTGFKKREPLQKRLAFAEEVMDDILDSADRPLTGRKWWMGAEEPWQTLACCMEVAKAVRASDPAAYVSHLPVHQDGSCNGLQHYAALGRDSVGAASVNLEPSDVPQDVYSGVAAQVEVFRRQDAQRGTRVAQVLEGFITRKVVKQTVMTVVYGVTRYGGRLQIEKRLRELNDFPQEFVWEASHYLVRQVFKSLQEMFSGTRAIQHWLTESARLISHTGSVVEWVTPLGVPIIQPYRLESKVKQLGGGIQSITYTHNGDISRKGLTFVSVHDCYWTHAADVSVMNQVCREQFVHLHSEPILQDLSKFLVKRFCSEPRKILEASQLKQTLQAVPKPGAFDLEQVKHSTYFFS